MLLLVVVVSHAQTVLVHIVLNLNHCRRRSSRTILRMLLFLLRRLLCQQMVALRHRMHRMMRCRIQPRQRMCPFALLCLISIRHLRKIQIDFDVVTFAQSLQHFARFILAMLRNQPFGRLWKRPKRGALQQWQRQIQRKQPRPQRGVQEDGDTTAQLRRQQTHAHRQLIEGTNRAPNQWRTDLAEIRRNDGSGNASADAAQTASHGKTDPRVGRRLVDAHRVIRHRRARHKKHKIVHENGELAAVRVRHFPDAECAHQSAEAEEGLQRRVLVNVEHAPRLNNGGGRVEHRGVVAAEEGAKQGLRHRQHQVQRVALLQHTLKLFHRRFAREGGGGGGGDSDGASRGRLALVDEEEFVVQTVDALADTLKHRRRSRRNSKWRWRWW
mmetsp:Transcript_34841/g.56844  ORF Transcript_34841/g.56844 Transcript_34841/m.56844 type:complete len:384 (+) Transcript_34841:495-1646(+)